jgi:hypothetical protein
MKNPIMRVTIFVVLGAVFGWALGRGGAADYDQVQRMFRLESFQLWGIIGVAVAIAAPGIWLLRRHGRTIGGEPIVVSPKPLNRGNVAGGILFGAGWAITGMCPGPIFVNIGEGKVYALAALAGALAGAALFGGVLRRSLERILRLPPISSTRRAA